MALKLWRRKLLLTKLESTYATDPTPVAGSNAMLVSNLRITPLEATYEARDLERPYLGGDEQIPVDAWVTLEFDVELAGAGAAGTAPKYGPLLRGCGMAETINAGTDVQYLPVSTGQESVTCYWFQDGLRQVVVGARGTFSLRLAKSPAIPMLSFRMIGKYAAPTDVSLPSPTYTGWQKPLAVNDANTPTVTLHAFNAVLRELSVDLGNQVELVPLVNSETIEITDRETTGRAAIALPAIADIDFYTRARAVTTGALQVVHGTAAGGIVQVDAPVVQVTNPRHAESQGIAMMEMDLRILPSASDDELKLTVK